MASQDWYVNFHGDVQGPFTPRKLREFAAQKSIIPATNIRLGESGEWMLAESVNGLFSLHRLTQIASLQLPNGRQRVECPL